MRDIRRADDSCVIAGSYATAQHLLQKGEITFRPGDLDVFVFDEDGLRRVAEMYREVVADPLRLSLNVRRKFVMPSSCAMGLRFCAARYFDIERVVRWPGRPFECEAHGSSGLWAGAGVGQAMFADRDCSLVRCQERSG